MTIASSSLRTAIYISLAVAFTITGAIVHGHVTGRWSQSRVLPEAAKKLANVAESIGPWRMTHEEPFNRRAAEMLQCAGFIHREYEHRDTGQRVKVAVIVGPPGPTSVHIPEICYSSRQYDIEGPRSRVKIQPTRGPSAEFWGVTFRSLDPSLGLLRVLYAWNGAGQWVAPDSPRIALRTHQALYKMQLAAELPLGADPTTYDPCGEFLRDFLPALPTQF